jgi:predicted flap endonuclease-1-like 5' DNA nuclease
MRRMTKIGSYIIGIAAGAAAVVWLVKDRLLGPETVPLQPEDAPAFRVAPGPPSHPSVSDDDLSQVKGIGPVYRARLEQAGITTFSALALATTAEIASAAEIPADKAEDWIKQAAGLIVV